MRCLLIRLRGWVGGGPAAWLRSSAAAPCRPRLCGVPDSSAGLFDLAVHGVGDHQAVRCECDRAEWQVAALEGVTDAGRLVQGVEVQAFSGPPVCRPVVRLAEQEVCALFAGVEFPQGLPVANDDPVGPGPGVPQPDIGDALPLLVSVAGGPLPVGQGRGLGFQCDLAAVAEADADVAAACPVGCPLLCHHVGDAGLAECPGGEHGLGGQVPERFLVVAACGGLPGWVGEVRAARSPGLRPYDQRDAGARFGVDAGVAQGTDQGAAARVAAGVPVFPAGVADMDFAAGLQVQAENEQIVLHG